MIRQMETHSAKYSFARRLAIRILFCLIMAYLSPELAAAPTRILQTEKQNTTPVNQPPSETDIRPLEVGRPVEREMKEGETHAYRLTLMTGQCLHAVLYQRGIDVVVTVLGPDNKPIMTVDSLNGTNGPEPVWIIAQVSGNYRLEVRPLNQYAQRGRYDLRIEGLRAATEMDRRRVMAQGFLIEAERQRAQGKKENLQNAIAKYQEALALLRKVEDGSAEAITLYSLGVVYQSMEERQKARDYYNQALLIYQKIGDRAGEATSLNNLGTTYNTLEEKQKALDYYNQALLIYQKIGDPAGEAIALNNFGASYNTIGEKQKALDYYNQALSLYQKIADPAGKAIALTNVGATYNAIGEKRKALDYYNQALLIYQKIGDPAGEAVVLNSTGRVYNSMGDKQKALSYYNQALAIYQRMGSQWGEDSVRSNIGLVYNTIGEKQKALDYYTQALPIYRKVGNRVGEAIVLINLGTFYYSIGDTQRALDYYKQSLSVSQKIGDREGESNALNNIGWVYNSMGEKQKALSTYQQSIAKLESLRAGATIEEIKTYLTEESASVYERVSLLLMSLHQEAQAFNFTESARARTFLDQLGNLHPNIRKTTNAQLVREEEELASELTALEIRLREQNSKPLSALEPALISSIENQLATKRRAYENLLIRLKLTNPEYASLRSVDTLKLPAVQQLLDEHTTLLSYFVTSEKTLAFIVSRDSFKAFEIRVKESDLTANITWFRSFASLRDSQPQALNRLYTWLIAPIKPYIKTPRVAIIPHGILHYLPFSALSDGQHYFGDEYSVFYLPSASVLPFIQKKSKPVGDQVLALAQSQSEGLPMLQYADQEVEAVARLYNTQAMTTGRTSKADFLKKAGDYSILHIAAHAELKISNPLFSRFLLASDKGDSGALEVRQVYDLDLSKTSLVVLSGCGTQLGAQSKGDDIVGLNRAFIYAGTPTVIASLWTVDDGATEFLMKSFYTHLKQGMSKAEALRAAQSETRANSQYLHPYYWAAFVLTGDPGWSSSGKTDSKQ